MIGHEISIYNRFVVEQEPLHLWNLVSNVMLDFLDGLEKEHNDNFVVHLLDVLESRYSLD